MALAQHSGFTNWGDYKSNWITTNQLKCWFLVRGENRSTQEKTSQSRVDNQRTQSTYNAGREIEPGRPLLGGKSSHYCTNSAEMSTLKCNKNTETTNINVIFVITCISGHKCNDFLLFFLWT